MERQEYGMKSPATEKDDGSKKKRALLIVLLALVLLCGTALAITSFITGVKIVDLPQYLAGTAGIDSSQNSEVEADVQEYTSFQSVSDEDSKWVAGSTSQSIVLANMPENNVDMAPHIYVDIDKDGSFSESECVYNPIKMGENGKVESYGLFIQPGQQIDMIEISQLIPTGEYDAYVEYTTVTRDTHEIGNSMRFDFKLTVE